eukprot:m.433880 g.433880  ORF g.433880 m.433880 type:complete len:421 (+) comp17636_c0_seq1:80-1342(+)
MLPHPAPAHCGGATLDLAISSSLALSLLSASSDRTSSSLEMSDLTEASRPPSTVSIAPPAAAGSSAAGVYSAALDAGALSPRFSLAHASKSRTQVSVEVKGSTAPTSPTSARARMSAKLYSSSNSPSLNTDLRQSRLGSPFSTVDHTPSLHSRVSRPRFDFLPLSVIGFFETSRETVLPSTSTSTHEHLYAHLSVSRLSFCSSPPPEPKATMSVHHPKACMWARIFLSCLRSTPSPWISRMNGGSSRNPFELTVVPNWAPRISRHLMTTSGGWPESGRTTSTPLRLETSSRSLVPQSSLQASQMLKLSDTQATRPSGNEVSMFLNAAVSSSGPHEVMVECSDAGIENPATVSAGRLYTSRAEHSAARVSVPIKLTRWAQPPMAADSHDETPRKPKSWSLNGRPSVDSAVAWRYFLISIFW